MPGNLMVGTLFKSAGTLHVRTCSKRWDKISPMPQVLISYFLQLHIKSCPEVRSHAVMTHVLHLTDVVLICYVWLGRPFNPTILHCRTIPLLHMDTHIHTH
eukprot:scpid111520/ scgid13285/ 